LARSPALRSLLSSLDALVGALAQQQALRADLGVPLKRGEAQCTCYPGDGARYAQHVDDVNQRVRKLTCIVYANPDWVAEAGGELRLHLIGQLQMKDVAPLDGRLVLFFSDSRVPHEVLPTHKPRYAVSVWYHTTQG
jgi:Rps23 Pro-64 3,4-dihydroxylase Tpa1-like proline 4-hydroxylase